jgi:tRNA pseudouridine55 synthase
MQVPPMYSALHHEGRRLYKLARTGVELERPARPVTIERLELLNWQAPLLMLDIMSSKGTYIRALARDLGAAIGCGAHLHALRRTAVGTFHVEDAIPLGALEADPAALGARLLPAESAVADWPAYVLSDDEARRARHGQTLALEGLSGERARAHAPDGTLLALLVRAGERWKPEKVFDWTGAESR